MSIFFEITVKFRLFNYCDEELSFSCQLPQMFSQDFTLLKNRSSAETRTQRDTISAQTVKPRTLQLQVLLL